METYPRLSQIETSNDPIELSEWVKTSWPDDAQAALETRFDGIESVQAALDRFGCVTVVIHVSGPLAVLREAVPLRLGPTGYREAYPSRRTEDGNRAGARGPMPKWTVEGEARFIRTYAFRHSKIANGALVEYWREDGGTRAQVLEPVAPTHYETARPIDA